MFSANSYFFHPFESFPVIHFVLQKFFDAQLFPLTLVLIDANPVTQRANYSSIPGISALLSLPECFGVEWSWVVLVLLNDVAPRASTHCFTAGEIILVFFVTGLRSICECKFERALKRGNHTKYLHKINISR